MTETAASVPAGPVQRALDRLADAAIAIAATALVGLVVVQGWQVFTRYVLNDSPSWTEPVTLLLLSTAMSLGAAAGVHTNKHFSFHLLAESLPSVGSVLFIGTSIGKITVAQSMRTIWPFWLSALVVLLIVAFFPELSLWLPRALKG